LVVNLIAKGYYVSLRMKPRLTNEPDSLERQAAQRESASRTELEEKYIDGYDEGFADGYLVGVQDTVRKFEGREL
jgi:hypothetical protein